MINYKIKIILLFVLIGFYGYPVQERIIKRNVGQISPRGTLNSVTTFIGQSRLGPINKAVKIRSFREFISIFGTSADSEYLAHAVGGFFQNGGRICYVANIGFDRGLRTERNFINVLRGNAHSRKKTGIMLFDKIKEISIVCAPGITNPNDQNIIVKHCEKIGDRFVILDAQRDVIAGVGKLKKPLVSPNAAVYFPWLKVYDSQKNKFIYVPPSGHVAGIYARVDAQRGIHKAPAGNLFPLKGVKGLEYNLDQEEINILTSLSINPIRSFPGSGFLIWGARTLSNNPQWKYVNIRRFFLYQKKNITELTKWAVYEPNNTVLWNKLQAIVSEYLLQSWKSGALLGSKPAEGFFVKCDSSTNTPDMIQAGLVQILVGIALLKPAEFIIFKIQHKTVN